MVEIVVHLLLINEHFFVPNLYVSGNGNDFSSTLESNIWDYVMYSRAELSMTFGVCPMTNIAGNVISKSFIKNPYSIVHMHSCELILISGVSPRY